MSAPVSVLILTLNEELNLPRALRSVSWCDDIVVLDSHSSDSTEAIARGAGARFFQRKFDNYVGQRTFGLKGIPYKHDWVLLLDADEAVTPELVSEIRDRITQCDADTAMFRVRCKYFLFGRWLKHSASYSTLWLSRLLRHDRVWLERTINEEYHTDGTIGALESSLLHYPFNKGFHSWLEKHNRYSTMEAELKFRGETGVWTWRGLLNRDPVTRRRTLKALAYALPGRPLIMFFGLYLLKGGILDGRAGLTYCLLKTIYEYMIDCKVRELQHRARNLPV